MGKKKITFQGKSKTVEKIPYKTDKKAVTVFLNDDEEDTIWEYSVAINFIKGYPEKDAAYDKL